jgi:hypothetical protein
VLAILCLRRFTLEARRSYFFFLAGAFLAAFFVAFLAAFLVAFFIDLFSVTSDFAVASRQHCDLFINLESECCQEKNEAAAREDLFSGSLKGVKQS